MRGFTRLGRSRSVSDHRAVLDHVLGVVCADECGESLVLRGSASLLAYAPDAAREPHDLDWVVRPVQVVASDEFPYLPDRVPVRTWPEAAHGAVAAPTWDDNDDFDTGGAHPVLPPDGLRWIDDIDPEALPYPHRDVIALLARNPIVTGSLRLDPDGIVEDATFGYAYDEESGGGVRLRVPWHRRRGPGGTLRLDFAYDEQLLEPPQLAAVPRAAGGPPIVAWAATPALSLMWKLQWLCLDQAAGDPAAGKDLYDAVLLAEMPQAHLSSRLTRHLHRRVPNASVLAPDAVLGWQVHRGDLPMDPAEWLARLATAISAT